MPGRLKRGTSIRTSAEITQCGEHSDHRAGSAPGCGGRDLSGVAFHQPLTGEVGLPPGSTFAVQSLGFSPHTPRQLPAGWRLLEVAKLTDPTEGRTWAKLVYSDGVELVFFVEAEPPGPGFQVHTETPVGPDRVRSLSIGPWTVLQGELSGREVVVMGRQAEQVLVDMIQSAFP